jgi:hypothetical protein
MKAFFYVNLCRAETTLNTAPDDNGIYCNVIQITMRPYGLVNNETLVWVSCLVRDTPSIR